MTPTQAEMQAAIDAINEHGFDIRAPWECDLDDRELEQFNGLCAAVTAAMRAATLLLEQAQACIMHETPEGMTFGEAEDDTLGKIRKFLNRAPKEFWTKGLHR
jgi:hypothetical protein